MTILLANSNLITKDEKWHCAQCLLCKTSIIFLWEDGEDSIRLCSLGEARFHDASWTFQASKANDPNAMN